MPALLETPEGHVAVQKLLELENAIAALRCPSTPPHCADHVAAVSAVGGDASARRGLCRPVHLGADYVTTVSGPAIPNTHAHRAPQSARLNCMPESQS